MSDTTDVQLLVGATVAAAFTDANILRFLDLGGSVFMAAALALKARAASLAEDMHSETIGDYEYTKAQAASLAEGLDSEKIGDYAYSKKIIDNYVKLAANFEERDASTPAFDWAEMDLLGVEPAS